MNDSSTARTCPVCTAELGVVTHEGVAIDRCPVGHGVWLDRGELRIVVASEEAPRSAAEIAAVTEAARVDHGAAVVAEADRPARACPVCASSMRLTEYAGSGIPIDECSEHGAWLDAGELERIEAYAEGVRRQARSAAPSSTLRTVGGVDVPESLLATLRTVGSPPPG